MSRGTWSRNLINIILPTTENLIPVNTVLPMASPNPPIINTPMVYTPGTWSGGTPVFDHWEAFSGGVWIDVSADMPNANSAPTDNQFGLSLRLIETNTGAEAVSAATAAVTGGLYDSLIAYWKLDEASGNRADSYGPHTLTDNNTVTQAAGKVGNAAYFVAANTESLSVADHVDLRAGDRDFSCDLWFYADNLVGTQFIMSQGSASSGAGLGFSLFLNTSNLQVRMASGATNATLTIGAVSAATWYYVAIWYDAATNTLWAQLNGDAAVSVTLVGAANGPAGALRYGASQTAATPLTGRIDEAARWNRALTGTDRMKRYNGGSGNTLPF
jgi:hypothetical protein